MTDCIVDVYHKNPVQSWPQIAGAGIAAVWLKATEGLSGVDMMYAKRKPDALSAGLLVGAYAYGHDGSDGADQAKRLLDVAGTDVLHCLDLERGGKPMLLATAEKFVATIKTITGRLPVLYSGEYLKSWNYDLTKAAPTLVQCPLWLSEYKSPVARLPFNWKAWTFWQYTDEGTVPGIDGNVDRSRFNGTIDELRDFWQGTPAIGNTDSSLPAPITDNGPFGVRGNVILGG